MEPVATSSASPGNDALTFLDRMGFCVSTACAVHCLLLPFLITVLPLIGLGFFVSHRGELYLLAFAVVTATASFCWGTRRHGKFHTLLFLVAAGLFFFIAHSEPNLARHGVLMAVGGSCLAAGHFLNRRLCKSCHACACEHGH